MAAVNLRNGDGALNKILIAVAGTLLGAAIIANATFAIRSYGSQGRMSDRISDLTQRAARVESLEHEIIRIKANYDGLLRRVEQLEGKR